MKLAVLVPVKGFTAAKRRLSAALSPGERIRLARWLADRVVTALGETATFIACDDPDVRDWAVDRGAHVCWGPGLGLNGAVDDGVDQIAAAGFDHVVVTHADLPFPRGLLDIARPATTTLVPDRARDGTNVMSFPTHAPLAAAYGPGSFSRHLDRAIAAGHSVEVRSDVHLSLDIDTPRDLAHPLTSEVLPTWLPTTPANRFLTDP